LSSKVTVGIGLFGSFLFSSSKAASWCAIIIASSGKIEAAPMWSAEEDGAGAV